MDTFEKRQQLRLSSVRVVEGVEDAIVGGVSLEAAFVVLCDECLLRGADFGGDAAGLPNVETEPFVLFCQKAKGPSLRLLVLQRLLLQPLRHRRDARELGFDGCNGLLVLVNERLPAGGDGIIENGADGAAADAAVVALALALRKRKLFLFSLSKGGLRSRGAVRCRGEGGGERAGGRCVEEVVLLRGV